MKNILIKTLTVALVMVTSIASHAQGKGEPCPNRFGSDSVKAQEQLSLFNQYLQQKDYIKSFKYWQYLYENAPCAQKYVTYQGSLIAKKYMVHLKKTNDSMFKARKEGLIDTVLMVYDSRIQYWGKEGYVLGKKAGDLAKLKPKERQAALRLFEKSVELEGNKTSYAVPMNYMKTAIKEHKKDAYSLDSLYQLYFQLMDIIDYNIKNNAKKSEKYKLSEKTVNKMMKPYLNCEKVEEYFKPKVDEGANDTALLKKVSGLLVSIGCEKSIFFLDVAEKVYQLEPSPESAKTIAIGRHANKEYKQAIDWYQKSLEGNEADSTKAKTYMTIATLYSKKLKNNSAANGAATKALELDPSKGGAYFIKAAHYASQAGACGADKIDGSSVYWAAADACLKAKTANPKLAGDATKLYNYYASKFPTKEDAFFKGFTAAEGSSYTVPCLGVVTKVRFKK